MLQHILLDLRVGCPVLKLRHIHIFQRELNPNLFGVDFSLGKQDYSLNMARLLQIDVKNPPDRAVRSRKYINGIFDSKIAIFSTALVLGNRSIWLSLLINMEPANPPIASILRSEGTSPKSHRLNLNSSRDRICTFFRFRMDMDHYVLSSLASLLFPEP